MRTWILGKRPGSNSIEILTILEGLFLGPSLMRMEKEDGVNESGKWTCLFLPSSGGYGEDEPWYGGYSDGGMVIVDSVGKLGK